MKRIEAEVTLENMLEEDAARLRQKFQRVFDRIRWREQIPRLSSLFPLLNPFVASGRNISAELEGLQEFFDPGDARLRAPCNRNHSSRTSQETT